MMDRIVKLKRLLVGTILIAAWRPAIAGMERTTPSPTPVPTPPPTPAPTVPQQQGPPGTSPVAASTPAPVDGTSEPTVEPSRTPSSPPTRNPTSVPTPAAPSEIPSPFPTELVITSSPTKKPSASPSQAPSTAPSTLPTKAPITTDSPTIVKSAAPTGLVVVSLPLISVAVSVAAGDTIDQAKFQSELTSFSSNILSSSSFRDSFQYVILTANPYSDSAYLVRGKAYYQPDSYPSEQELEDILKSYFSFFGAQKLTEYLNAASVPVEDVKVEVGAGIISGIDSGSEQPENGDDVNVGIVAGAAVGSVVFLAIVIGLAVAMRARQKKTLSLTTEVKRGTNNVPETSPSNDWLAKELPSFVSRAQSRRPSEIGSVSSDDLVSYAERSMLSIPVDGPIFVFAPMEDERSRSPPNEAVKYDISRLDQVISSAKDFTHDFAPRKR